MTALVELRDVFRVYPSAEGGVAALQGLTLSVQRGEICVVLGPSGSGKSTLLRLVAGFDRPSAGSVSVAGVDVARLGAWAAGRFRSRALGYADQHYWRALAGELTARELVGVQLGLAGEARARRDARADELLERVGLGARARRPPARALRRRAAAGRALRRGRAPAAAADRRRADRRARRGDRARGVRPDRRAVARGRRHGARRQPRPGLDGARRPRRPRPRRPRQRRARRRRGPTARSSSAAAAGCACRRSCSARPASTATRRRACATASSSSRRRDLVLNNTSSAPPRPFRLNQAVRRELVLIQHKPSRRAG